MMHLPRRSTAYLFCLLLLFSFLVVATIHTKRPNIDEGWFSSPVYNLTENGVMGTTVIEERGTPYVGINEHTYWITPLSFVFNAGWASLFGMDFISLRYASLCWSLVSLLSLFYLTRKIVRSEGVALLSVLTMASSYFFVQQAADIRMDMMAQALMLLGLAVYVNMREKYLLRAVLLAETMIMLSGMTHPHGILGFVALHVIVLLYDRKRLTVGLVLCAMLPYLVGAVAWGLYIIQDVQAFKSQFFSNSMNRFHGMGFWKLLLMEVKVRYLESYGFSAGGSTVSMLKSLVLGTYVASLASVLVVKSFRTSREMVAIFIITLFILGFLVFQLNKAKFYLISPLPFVSILVAMLASYAGTVMNRKFVTILFCGFILIQLLSSANTVRKDNLHHDFYPLKTYLQNQEVSSICGSAELAFLVDFSSKAVDDPYLGYLTGKKAKIVVQNKRYKDFLRNSADAAFKNYVARLFSNMDKVLENEFYTVYVAQGASMKLMVMTKCMRHLCRHRSAGIRGRSD